MKHKQHELEEVREALAREEAALRTREAVLHRELGADAEPGEAPSFWRKIRDGMSKTRHSLSNGLATVLLGKKELDRDVLEKLEELLLSSDMGIDTAGRLLSRLRERARRSELSELDRLKQVLKEEIHQVMSRRYSPMAWEGKQPGVILFLGVNGTGKTTSIGKLAARYTGEGKRVLLAAGDTFRAAATEQLARWAERTGCEIVSRPEGSDPSGVIFQAVEHAQAGKFDLLLCDTAGRLHTKHNLMEELKKIKRVIAKSLPGAPHETWLVLDANTGQNAIHQTREFHQAVGLTGLIVTKLDGTARGGVVVGIVNEFDLPIRYVGVGESAQDLEPFDAEAFADNLLE
jgi:fused signal recognition particle receptor